MPTPEFQIFGTPHLVVMALTLAVPILLAEAARRAASKTVADAGAWLLAGTLLVNESIHWGYRLNNVGWSRCVQDHLPLHVCGITIVLTAAVLIFRRQRIYEVAYFWGLAGSTNAVITPGDLEAGFPDYRFFQYFIAHSGIVAGVLYATLALKMRPTLGGLFQAFVALNVLAVVLGVVNFLLGFQLHVSLPAPRRHRIPLLLRRMALVHPHHRPDRAGDVLRPSFTLPRGSAEDIESLSRPFVKEIRPAGYRQRVIRGLR